MSFDWELIAAGNGFIENEIESFWRKTIERETSITVTDYFKATAEVQYEGCGASFEGGSTREVFNHVKESFYQSEKKKTKASCGVSEQKEYVAIWQQVVNVETSDGMLFTSRQQIYRCRYGSEATSKPACVNELC